MTTLHLGVIDIPYNEAPETAKRGRKAKRSAATVTTGDVATFLEDKYHVMEVFFEEEAEVIADALAESLAGTIESLAAGAPPTIDPFGPVSENIRHRFQEFIDLKKLDGVIPGVPTKASLEGVRSRFKDRLDPGRPSFQDTGLYEASFRAWFDNAEPGQ